MTRLTPAICATLVLGFASTAQAEGLSAFGFTLKRAASGVEGVYVVDGYGAGQMRSLIGQ